ncbi:MAG TPA: cell division protein ZapE [Geminicoccaceae bacterium]
MTGEVTAALRRRLEADQLEPDPAQADAAAQLDDLALALGRHNPAERAPRGLLGRLRRERRAASEAPRGLYIHGPVGSGKSMLMNLFFEAVADVPKRRVHFHAFMLEVHERLNRYRQQKEGAPVEALAEAMADDARLLCFDEFVVQNIADAMILGRLFEGLFGAGVVVVATSNFEPDRLYEGGLNRDRFLPFIELLKERVRVVELAGGRDYRRGRLSGAQLFQHPWGPAAREALDALFEALATRPPEPFELEIGARRLAVPAAADGIARFGFEDLCARPLGSRDYLALTDHFHMLIIDDVPRLTPDKRNEARRFITLIDALYECRVKLAMSLEAPPDELYARGEGAFEFQRTVSRLMEMQSLDYLTSAKRPLAPGTNLDYALTSDLM